MQQCLSLPSAYVNLNTKNEWRDGWMNKMMKCQKAESASRFFHTIKSHENDSILKTRLLERHGPWAATWES